MFHLEEIYNALDDDEELKQCIRKLKQRFGIRSVITDSNEAMWCKVSHFLMGDVELKGNTKW